MAESTVVPQPHEPPKPHSTMMLNGILWLTIFVATDAIKSLTYFLQLHDAGKEIIWMHWAIAFWSLILAGATGVRLFLDQSYARWREGRLAGEKRTETEFYRQQNAAK